jgi:DNA-directed RNA polymerase specialized sigma subunit
MNKQRLNELVLAYQDGNESAVNDLFQAINPLIERTSLEIERLTDDATKFDCRMIYKLKKLIEKFDATKGHDFLSSAKALITQEKSDFMKRRKRKREDVSMSALEGESEEDLGYQFESKENTEHDVLFKERVTLLAQGNPKRQMVLIQWSKGADDKSISVMLAHHFGGKAESHRKFVTRFKTECRDRLTAEHE